jgi:predicted enzyme related to lactoylglutathione lyase
MKIIFDKRSLADSVQNEKRLSKIHILLTNYAISVLNLLLTSKSIFMDKTTNSLNWFEIPAQDINRAKKFYEDIFSIEMPVMSMMGMEMAMFPGEEGNGKASGCLCQSPNHTPSQTGSVIYLNANPDMSTILERIPAAGGSIAMPKTQISPEVGFMAFFTDTEGNRVALHSSN